MIIRVKYGLFFFVLTKISFDTKLSNLQCSAKQLIYGMHKPWSQWKCLHALFFNHIVEESMTDKIKKHYFWARVKKYIFHKLYFDFYTVHVSLNKDKIMNMKCYWKQAECIQDICEVQRYASICVCVCMYVCLNVHSYLLFLQDTEYYHLH